MRCSPPTTHPPRRVLITGATGGLGAAFAAAMPPTANLLLVARDAERLKLVSRQLVASGRSVETLSADLSDPQGVATVIERAEAFGIDLLINNAGVGTLGRVIDNPMNAEQATVAVNVAAVVQLTRGLVPGMLRRAREENRRAGLITVSSTAAFVPVPTFATYAATKAFELHYTEALAEELAGDPINVLCLCPGAVRTGFGARAGYRGGAIPGAADPDDVVRQALAALGRRRVLVTGAVGRAAFGPWLRPRRAVTGALGAALRGFAGQMPAERM